MKDTRTHVAIGGVLHTGRELHVLESVSLEEFSGIRFERPLNVELRLRRIGRGVEVSGTIVGEAEGECARCLDDVRLPLKIVVEERLDPEREVDDPLGESNVLAGDELDLHDLVRQLVDSALPIALLCREDCAGLCATCGSKAGSTCSCPTRSD